MDRIEFVEIRSRRTFGLRSMAEKGKAVVT